MSMFISSFLPNGNYLIAADTRVCGTRSDGFHIPIRDDFHKIIQLSDNTFVFMSGASNVCQIVIDALKCGFQDETANDRIVEIGNRVMSNIDMNSETNREFFKECSQAMVFSWFKSETKRFMRIYIFHRANLSR